MTEPPILNELASQQPAAAPQADRVQTSASGQAEATVFESAYGACARFARASNLVAWGLLTLGVVTGFGRVLPLAFDNESRAGAWISAWVDAVFSVLAYGLAGLSVAAVTTMTAAAICEYLQRVAQASEDLLAIVRRGVDQLDRIAHVLSRGGGPQWHPDPAALDRVHKLDEIRHAIRISQWTLAQSLVSAFAAEFPDDSQHSVVEAELKQARDHAREQHLAKLEAAREVNDPEGVLESYQLVQASLETEARATLDRDLGKWFLALIHRRLRSNKIQPDVVQLASRFAEAFAFTAEGASVRAALPMLRRSVGLCPRCESPYSGVGDACPKCLESISLRLDELDARARSSDS
jgi:hypothetical protein